MAKDKEKSINPAAAQRKAEKQKTLKKSKAAVAAQRTERFANRNPHKFESTISDLQSLKESQGGKLSARDQKQLEEAEKDLSRVKKAREALGDKAPTFNTGRGGHRDLQDGRRGGGEGRGRGGYGGLGKRGREDTEDGSGSETDEEVRRIPWPRDTPPPIPRQRRDDRPRHPHPKSTNANSEPLGAARRLPERPLQEQDGERIPDTSLPAKVFPNTRTTYESKPQVRDLRKEATQRFVPSAVKRKIDATKGKGGKLLEEEDVQRLEKEGYGGGGGGGGGVARESIIDAAPEVRDGKNDVEGRETRRLEEEEERFRQEMQMEVEEAGEDKEEENEAEPRGVHMEEVSDQDM